MDEVLDNIEQRLRSLDGALRLRGVETSRVEGGERGPVAPRRDVMRLRRGRGSAPGDEVPVPQVR